MAGLSEDISNAGRVYVEELFLTNHAGENIDLNNFLVEINIYEDIFSPVMHGTIVLADSVNLINNAPIIGHEFLTVKLRTPSLEDAPENIIERSFHVFSIEDRIPTGDSEQVYSLHFISLEGYQDQLTTLSQTYKGSTDEIISKIIPEFIKAKRIDGTDSKPLIVTDTPHISNITYTSNFWSPIKNLAFISRRCIGANTSASDFLFFEGNKAFYVASIENIIKSSVEANIVFDEYVFEPNSLEIPRRQTGVNYTSVGMPPENTRIESMQAKKTFNSMDGQSSGYYGGSIRGYDLLSKKMSEKTLNLFNPETGRFWTTDKGYPFPSEALTNPFSNEIFFSYNKCLYLKDGEKYGIDDENTGLPFLKRRSYLNSLDQIKFDIKIPGRTDIEVGVLLYILYPGNSVKVNGEVDIDEVMDPVLTGRYLVTALHHRITAMRHTIHAEVVKNGVSLDLGTPSAT